MSKLTDDISIHLFKRWLEPVLDAVQRCYRYAFRRLPRSWSRRLPSVLVPRATNNLPPIRTDYVERADVLEKIRAALCGGDHQAAITTTGAITGLGGIGKTMTALAYAYRHLADYDLIWWLRAESESTLEADFSGLAAPLGIDAEGLEPDQALRRIVEALGRRGDWLLVFDNVEEAASIGGMVPGTGGGHVLVTTRHDRWAGRGVPVPLGVMSEDEAVRVLLGPRFDSASEAERDEAGELAEELGCLPLALAQARAYCEGSGETLAGYHQLLGEAPLEVLGEKRTLPADYPLPVARAWALSMAKAGEVAEGARPLLELLSCLAPEAIPRDLFADHVDLLPPPLAERGAFNLALKALADYSLITLRRDGGGNGALMDMHRLVQVVTLAGLDKESARERLDGALALLNAEMPDVVGDHANCPAISRLLPHVERATALAEGKECDQRALGSLLNVTGLYHLARGSYDVAEPYLRCALAISERSPGANDPQTGARLTNLAGLLEVTGRYEEAEPLYLRALEIAERSLGTNDSQTGSSLNNLAGLLEVTGRYEEAEPFYLRALEIAENSLGADHPTTGKCLNNLAGLLKTTGRHGEAEPLYRRALAIAERSLGENHPTMGAFLNNLAGLLEATGRHGEAEPLYRRALSIAESSLGADHLKTGISLNNLAGLLADTGRHGDAESLYRRALAIVEAALPDDHPHIAIAADNLAAVLDKTGKPEEAAELRAKAAEVRRRRGEG